MLFKKVLKQQIDVSNKILLIVLGLENGGSFLAQELAQIVSLSKKNIKVIFYDNDIVSEQCTPYEKFLKSDIGNIKSQCTAKKCISSFNIDIATLNSVRDSDFLLKLTSDYLGYFPIIINNRRNSSSESFHINECVKKAFNLIGEGVVLNTEVREDGSLVSVDYKRNGEIIFSNNFDESKVFLRKSVVKKQNISIAEILFLYLDDILTERELVTTETFIDLKGNQISSKYIQSNYTKKKDISNANPISLDIGDNVLILIVGLGGTGASVAYEICHTVANSKKNCTLVFADGDLVELKNLIRQRFIFKDINNYKGACTATRCADAYGVDIVQYNDFIECEDDVYEILSAYEGYYPIILGCSDSLKLRELLGKAVLNINTNLDVPQSLTYIDAGNNVDSGQVICTIMDEGKLITSEFFKEYPDSINDLKTAKLVTHMSCDELMVSAPQTKGANLSAARGIYSFFEDVFLGNEIFSYLMLFDNTNKTVTSAKMI